ncbi:MAG: aminotransferase class IV [bacterium]|nr:aminotransferase class IV [bacterium]
MTQVYLNNTFVPESEARVSVFDHGYLYGDGIFETLRAYSGLIFRLQDHLTRLFESGRRLSFRLPWDRQELAAILVECLKTNGCEDAVLRLTISRGMGPPGLDPDLCKTPTLVVFTRPFAGYPEDLYERGISLALVNVRKNLPDAIDPQIKSANYLNNILAKIEAKKAGADEAVLLNHQGYLAEGTVSNLFFFRKGKLCTPSLDAGILDGVTRRTVLEIASDLGINVHEGLHAPNAMLQAEEVFMTNTTYEVMPVSRIDQQQLNLGPLSRRLREAFKRRVAMEQETHGSE